MYKPRLYFPLFWLRGEAVFSGCGNYRYSYFSFFLYLTLHMYDSVLTSYAYLNTICSPESSRDPYLNYSLIIVLFTFSASVYIFAAAWCSVSSFYLQYLFLRKEIDGLSGNIQLIFFVVRPMEVLYFVWYLYFPIFKKNIIGNKGEDFTLLILCTQMMRSWPRYLLISLQTSKAAVFKTTEIRR